MGPNLILGPLLGCVGAILCISPTREVATFAATFLETRVQLSSEVATKVATFGGKRIDCDKGKDWGFDNRKPSAPLAELIKARTPTFN